MTLIGGGVADVDDLNEALALAPTCVAADGGAALALQAGIVPRAVIGDFDSLPPKLADSLPPANLHRVAEQDSTDFDKAVRAIIAPVIVAVGFTGARLDHQLAAFHVLALHADRPCVLLGDREVVFHCPAQIALPLVQGDISSFFPMQNVAARSTGLRWPLDGLVFDPMTFVGTSNRATGAVQVWTERPGMLGIVPRRYLAAVTQALASAPLHGPRPVP